MLRVLVRLIVVIVILVGVGAFFFGYRWNGRDAVVDRPVGTSGSAPAVDTSRAREAGADVGEKVAEGASKAQRAMAEASLTAKIKAKMALDDLVRASAIDVDTDGTVVTLSGAVQGEAEHARALQLARETQGVARVIDRLRLPR